jgi:hypothetical protein
MQNEHCVKDGCDVEFTTGNYKITTSPKAEWSVVVNRAFATADMSHNRRIPDIDALAQSELCHGARLEKYEVISVVLYTGPMVIDIYFAWLCAIPL